LTKRSREDVEREIAALEQLDTKALQQRWRELYRTEPPPKIQSRLLRLAVAYRIQEKAFGGLKASSKRQMRAHLDAMRGSTTARPARIPNPAIRLAPGTQLVREWNGSTVSVDVIDGGFIWKGTTYRTLSAVAVAITGTKWSGPKFFGLAATGGKQRARTGAAAP
jgi:hypothetical protein